MLSGKFRCAHRNRRASAWRCAAQIDALEARRLFSALGGEPEEAPLPVVQLDGSVEGATSTKGATVIADNGALHPLSDLPLLHSYSAAAVKIYLDFDGAPAETWGDYSAPSTPAYDVDHDPTTFSDRELTNIREIWARVAEKFSPFSVDVTTEDPSSYAALQAMHEIIGGDGSWINPAWGGATFVGGFANGQTDSFIFSSNLTNGDPHNVAEATAHELGHAFGLQHQSVYDANALMTNEYNAGTSQTAPIMGRDYSATRGLWWDGPDQTGVSNIQDDLASIASVRNGFGYRLEDHGQTTDNADALAFAGNTVTTTGVITTIADTDTFSFTTGAGLISFKADVAQFGPMLDLKLLLLDGAGNTIASADTASLGETLTATVPAGNYFLQVASHGNYGDVGQYTLSGTIVASQSGGGSSTAQDQKSPPPVPTVPAPAPSGAPADVIDLGLTATLHQKHAIELQWHVPAGDIKHLKLQRSVDGKHWTTLAQPRRRARNFIDRNLARGRTYTYRIIVQSGAQTEHTDGVSALL